MSGSRLVPAVLSLALALAACTDGTDNASTTTARDGAGDDLAEFIALAEDQQCTDDVNRLYSIDGDLVLWHREGLGCADASYEISLYGSTLDDERCTRFDTIEGPITECSDTAVEALFDTMATNLDDPNLGLGDDHTVELVWDGNS